ncbi:MAG: ABC transporter ATP-binding protein, partial [Candidatus Heimdallarchaeota archaeon]|nr:ABC transporter ATP-binding protein [Candidatus Heimdallarchaeota archaeon]
IFWPMTDVFKHSLLIIVIFVGTWEIENRDLPIATFILFILLLNYYYWPMVSLANNYHRFQGAFASLERISNIAFDENLKEEDTGTIITDSFKGEIEFKDLGFGYRPQTPVLHNLDFKILPGQRVAIVGHTGAGKSTIASLLMRFYAPQTGQILIDGHPIENYKLSTLRSNINLVSQRILLFKGTIRENLKISKTDATEEELWSALESVQAREFIELLPDKLSTVIEENGKNLSVGQRQMISFARAILSNPSIIILDEATASVDLYTEAKIQDAIEVLLNNRTSISIAHRLTTILKSDHIIVLEQGNLIEQGSHEELLEKRGLYADMYKLYLETQSAKYLDKIKTVKIH